MKEDLDSVVISDNPRNVKTFHMIFRREAEGSTNSLNYSSLKHLNSFKFNILKFH